VAMTMVVHSPLKSNCKLPLYVLCRVEERVGLVLSTESHDRV